MFISRLHEFLVKLLIFNMKTLDTVSFQWKWQILNGIWLTLLLLLLPLSLFSPGFPVHRRLLWGPSPTRPLPLNAITFWKRTRDNKHYTQSAHRFEWFFFCLTKRTFWKQKKSTHKVTLGDLLENNYHKTMLK